MREYTSRIAPMMREFEHYRMASGRWSKNYNLYLSLFDRHCASSYADVDVLTQEMLDSWCAQRETEANNSCRSRIYAVVSFVRYLQKRGLTDVKTPDIPKKEARTYIPHAFSDTELRNFFDACDSIKSYSRTEEQVVDSQIKPEKNITIIWQQNERKTMILSNSRMMLRFEFSKSDSIRVLPVRAGNIETKESGFRNEQPLSLRETA